MLARLRAQRLVGMPLGRVLGWLYVTGAGTGLVWLALPHRPDRADHVLLGMVALAAVLGAALVRTARRVPVALLHGALLAIQLVIGVAYVVGGVPDNDARLFFLWATPYAALYCGWRAAAGHLVWTGAVVVACLVLMPATAGRNAVASGFALLMTLAATSVLAMGAAAALRAAEATQRHDATHDLLTGLGNRRRLLEELQETVAAPPDPAGYSCALVLLSLDGFTRVNDRYGYAAGDALLREISRLLAGVLRPEDLACRLGGDGFALVLHHLTDASSALAVAERAVAVAAGASVPAAPGLTVGASAGVRLLEDGLSASAALREADAALYAAKHARHSGPHLWTVGLRHDDLDQAELAEDLRAELRAAQDGPARVGQLRLVYMPIVDVVTLRVTGMESLARWRHPTRGDVPPEEFVGCAERAGLIGELTRWVLAEALTQAASWSLGSGRRIQIGVNISALQLGDLRIVDDVRDALACTALRPASLVLEVTETAAVDDLSAARRTLTALADLGLALALDDFGTGYSSLTYVQALPFDVLKVDRSFVGAAAAGDRRAVATIAAVGALAAQLQVDVVAEGVEDPAQLLALRTLGCGYAQGFGLSRPLEARAVTAALTAAGGERWTLEGSLPAVAVGAVRR